LDQGVAGDARHGVQGDGQRKGGGPGAVDRSGRGGPAGGAGVGGGGGGRDGEGNGAQQDANGAHVFSRRGAPPPFSWASDLSSRPRRDVNHSARAGKPRGRILAKCAYSCSTSTAP